MRAWFVDRIVPILLVSTIVAFVAIGSVSLYDQRHALESADLRLDRHCAFERIQLEQLQADLRSPRENTSRAARAAFSTLANTDFREVKLCAPEGAPLDPGDRALRCTVEFDADSACMQAIVANALLYVRGAR